MGSTAVGSVLHVVCCLVPQIQPDWGRVRAGGGGGGGVMRGVRDPMGESSHLLGLLWEHGAILCGDKSRPRATHKGLVYQSKSRGKSSIKYTSQIYIYTVYIHDMGRTRD